MTKLSCCFSSLVLAAGLLLGAASGAQAQTSLKIAGSRTITLLPVSYAQKQGYFKREGLDVQVLPVPAASAVVSAVVSGSAQIGYGGSVGIIFARAQNQPLSIFSALTFEEAKADGRWTWLMASERSGVRKPQDLAGKTIAMNATGGVCELLVREHLAKAGVPYESTKTIVVPFPQMQAALQLGNADAACVVEPMRTNIRTSPDVKGITVAEGILADAAQRYVLDVLFTRDDWGSANPEVLRKFHLGLASAFADYRKDPTLFRRQIAEEFKLGPAVVSLMKSDLGFSDAAPTVAELAPLVDGLKRSGMLKSELKPEALVLKKP